MVGSTEEIQQLPDPAHNLTAETRRLERARKRMPNTLKRRVRPSEVSREVCSWTGEDRKDTWASDINEVLTSNVSQVSSDLTI